MVDMATANLARVLDSQEQQWAEEQHRLAEDHIKKVWANILKAEEYVEQLLHKLKSWGGPLTAEQELEHFAKKAIEDKQLKTTLKTEVGYRRPYHTKRLPGSPKFVAFEQKWTIAFPWPGIHVLVLVRPQDGAQSSRVYRHSGLGREGNSEILGSRSWNLDEWLKIA